MTIIIDAKTKKIVAERPKKNIKELRDKLITLNIDFSIDSDGYIEINTDNETYIKEQLNLS